MAGLLGEQRKDAQPTGLLGLLARPVGQRGLLETIYGTIDLDRPALIDQQGHPETEKGITVLHPHMNQGRPTNIPSIWGGQHFPGPDDRMMEDWAVQNALRSGLNFPSYGSIDEAVEASKARSRLIGALRREDIERLMRGQR